MLYEKKPAAKSRTPRKTKFCAVMRTKVSAGGPETRTGRPRERAPRSGRWTPPARPGAGACWSRRPGSEPEVQADREGEVVRRVVLDAVVEARRRDVVPRGRGD